MVQIFWILIIAVCRTPWLGSSGRWGEYIDSNRQQQRRGETCTSWGALWSVAFAKWWWTQRVWNGRTYVLHVLGEKYTTDFGQNTWRSSTLRETRCGWKDNIRMVLRKYVSLWTVCNWLGVGISGELLWTRWLGVIKWGSSWPVIDLVLEKGFAPWS